jgi:hypothetical protein
MAHDDGTCTIRGGVKPVNVIPNLPIVISISYDSTGINEQKIICTDLLPFKNTTHYHNIDINVSRNSTIAGSMNEHS